ncbi:hypothetical protein RhiJN_06893 [Ceratobasidium sp. AG-Ba]|nr:hypothetical protein RhiJN_06893 [Ceratobasidium sp. AG-Ba]QRW07803.1 hypothetical protein RhiLY_06802 [Ceratobasidium sp. AG-Ba]
MSHHPKFNHDDYESLALLPMMSTSSPNRPCPPMASASVPVPVLVYVRGRSSTVSTSHWPLQTSSPPLATPRAGRLPQSSPIQSQVEKFWGPPFAGVQRVYAVSKVMSDGLKHQPITIGTRGAARTGDQTRKR